MEGRAKCESALFVPLPCFILFVSRSVCVQGESKVSEDDASDDGAEAPGVNPGVCVCARDVTRARVCVCVSLSLSHFLSVCACVCVRARARVCVRSGTRTNRGDTCCSTTQRGTQAAASCSLSHTDRHTDRHSWPVSSLELSFFTCWR